MKIRTNDITLIGLLAALIAVTGTFKVPTGIPGAEFQLSAPIAVAIAGAFGFWRYISAGLIASIILFLLGIHNLLNVEISMVFRIVAGGLIALLGPRFLVITVAGPIGSFVARYVLSFTIGVPFFPLLLSALPGMVLTAIASWPLYKMLVKVKEMRGVHHVQRNV
ncbi:hypothetical protein [Alkalihalobacterium elongatum]|uniref:hypothetical protein n=1 Tax=Alkalihalobacterium elongatum TaxID=2675466 RepID=UPI001C1F7805|nr:hypothetical protein [Alkalihalobacterium elongatum]